MILTRQLTNDVIRDFICDIRSLERRDVDAGPDRRVLTRLLAERNKGPVRADRYGWPLCLKDDA